MPTPDRPEDANAFDRWRQLAFTPTSEDSRMPRTPPGDTQLPLLTDDAPRRYRPLRRVIPLSDLWLSDEMPDAGLVASLRQFGVLFPVLLRGGTAPEVIDGRRRIAAAREAGFDTISALVFPPETPVEVIAALTLTGNVHRSANPMAEADAIQALLRQGWDAERIARQVRIPAVLVRRRLLLTNLRTPWRMVYEAGAITTAVAEQIGLLGPEDQGALWQWWQHQPPGVRLTAATLRRWREERDGAAPQVPLPLPEPPAATPASPETFAVTLRRLDGIGSPVRQQAVQAVDHPREYVVALTPDQVRALSVDSDRPAQIDALLQPDPPGLHTVVPVVAYRQPDGLYRIGLSRSDVYRMLPLPWTVQVLVNGRMVLAPVSGTWDTPVVSLTVEQARELAGADAEPAGPERDATARAALAAVRTIVSNQSRNQPLVEVTDAMERSFPGQRAAMERLLGPALIRPNRAPSWRVPYLAGAVGAVEAVRRIEHAYANGASHLIISRDELREIPGLETTIAALTGSRGEDYRHRQPGHWRWRLPLRATPAQVTERLAQAEATATTLRQQAEAAINRAQRAEQETLEARQQADRLQRALEDALTPVATEPVPVLAPGDVPRWQAGQGLRSLVPLLVAALEEVPADPNDESDNCHQAILEALLAVGHGPEGRRLPGARGPASRPQPVVEEPVPEPTRVRRPRQRRERATGTITAVDPGSQQGPQPVLTVSGNGRPDVTMTLGRDVTALLQPGQTYEIQLDMDGGFTLHQGNLVRPLVPVDGELRLAPAPGAPENITVPAGTTVTFTNGQEVVQRSARGGGREMTQVRAQEYAQALYDTVQGVAARSRTTGQREGHRATMPSWLREEFRLPFGTVIDIQSDGAETTVVALPPQGPSIPLAVTPNMIALNRSEIGTERLLRETDARRQAMEWAREQAGTLRSMNQRIALSTNQIAFDGSQMIERLGVGQELLQQLSDSLRAQQPADSRVASGRTTSNLNP